MAEGKSNILGTVVLLGGVALGGDYLFRGDESIIGKFLRSTMGAPKSEAPFPADPRHGRPEFGEPSTSPWEIPVKTLRAPFPMGPPDHTGAIPVPFKSSPTPHAKKKMKHGSSVDDMDTAAWEIAKIVYYDTSFQSSPTTKFKVGDTKTIHDDIMFVYDHPNPPEIFKKLARFHADHGADCLNPASPLYQQQRKLAGTAADLYENYMGVEKLFSREGFAYVGEMDEEDDRLAANGAESAITFNIGGAYYMQ